MQITELEPGKVRFECSAVEHEALREQIESWGGEPELLEALGDSSPNGASFTLGPVDVGEFLDVCEEVDFKAVTKFREAVEARLWTGACFRLPGRIGSLAAA